MSGDAGEKSNLQWPILMGRAVLDDDVPKRLGVDAYVLACVLITQQDRKGRRKIGFWREQLCNLCGFPSSNTERLRAAREALRKDGWLMFTPPKNGQRGQTYYDMQYKQPGRNSSCDPGEIRLGDAENSSENPGESRSGEVCDLGENGPGGELTRADSVVQPGRNSSCDPGEIRTPSIPIFSIPIFSINTPPPPEVGVGEAVQESPLEPDSVPKKPPRPQFTDAEVDAIYAAYPRKKKPIDAKRAIQKLAGKIEFGELHRLVCLYADARRLPGQDPNLTPYPASWLNGGCWLEDPDEWLKIDGRSRYGPADLFAGQKAVMSKFNQREEQARNGQPRINHT